MKDLKAIFAERDKFFSDKTLEIFTEIDTTLAVVTTFLSDVDDMVSQGTIIWEDVSYMEELVVIIGVVQYDIGKFITVGQAEMEITADNVEQFNRVVHMSIPYELVLGDDPEAILDFLYTMGTDAEQETIEAKAQSEYLDAEFDLSDLTEEQRKQLEMFDKGNS